MSPFSLVVKYTILPYHLTREPGEQDIYLEHRPQPVVPTSLVAPEVGVEPPLFLRGVAVVQVDVVVVVAMAMIMAVVPEHGVVEAARRQQRQPREAHGQR